MMDGAQDFGTPNAVQFSQAQLDLLIPMHVLVSDTGHVIHAGPTLDKLVDAGMEGTRFLELFEVRRPRNVTKISALSSEAGVRLSLRLRDNPAISLKGCAMLLPGRQGTLLVALTFGISVVEAVTQFELNNGDFAPTDLTTELLYLVEAKGAVMAESHKLNQRLRGAKIAAEEQAYTDTLTGLKNRRAMDMILDRYRGSDDNFALVHLDLDHFKEVNDTLGHAAGDHVLQVAARIFVDETRADDTVVRFGGDEFVLILHKLTKADRLAKVSGRILKRLAEPIPFEGEVCQIGGSIGITMSNDYAEFDPEQMLRDADMALYASKKAGRGCATFIRDAGGVGQSAAAVAAAAPIGRD